MFSPERIIHNFFKNEYPNGKVLHIQNNNINVNLITQLKQSFNLKTHLHLPNSVFFETSGTFMSTEVGLQKTIIVIRVLTLLIVACFTSDTSVLVVDCDPQLTEALELVGRANEQGEVPNPQALGLNAQVEAQNPDGGCESPVPQREEDNLEPSQLLQEGVREHIRRITDAALQVLRDNPEHHEALQLPVISGNNVPAIGGTGAGYDTGSTRGGVEEQ